jgi:hypothetical protein
MSEDTYPRPDEVRIPCWEPVDGPSGCLHFRIDVAGESVHIDRTLRGPIDRPFYVRLPDGSQACLETPNVEEAQHRALLAAVSYVREKYRHWYEVGDALCLALAAMPEEKG